jgi:MFS family permease
LALISSGQYIAGVLWPSLLEQGMARYGWQSMFLTYAVVVVVVILPLTLLFLRPAPESHRASAIAGDPRKGASVLGLRPNLVQGLICGAAFLCCIPMAMPNSHLVAFCSDLGFPASQGAAMLSVLLACAFISRQFWGMLADRIGGLRSVMAGSACQAVAIGAFLLTQNEIGLFAVSAAFGLGFSGIIPSYVVAIRELFPASEASWRVPTFLFLGMSGMAFGSWLAGALYDHFGFYAPAFAAGVVFNVLNLVVLGFLVARQRNQARVVLAFPA